MDVREKYCCFCASQGCVVISHSSLAVVNLQQPRIHHLLPAHHDRLVHRHTLSARNCGSISCRRARRSAIQRLDTLANVRLPAQPADQLNLLRKAQILHASARTSRKLLIELLDRCKVLGDLRIFVQPREIYAAQVDWLFVGCEARAGCEVECLVVRILVKGYVGCLRKLADRVRGA
jgi:hypothetical protein